MASGLLGAATLRGTERALCSPLATFVYCRRVCTLWRLALFRCMVRFVSFPVRHWQCDSLPGCVPCGHLHQQTTTSHSVARTQPQPPHALATGQPHTHDTTYTLYMYTVRLTSGTTTRFPISCEQSSRSVSFVVGKAKRAGRATTPRAVVCFHILFISPCTNSGRRVPPGSA